MLTIIRMATCEINGPFHLMHYVNVVFVGPPFECVTLIVLYQLTFHKLMTKYDIGKVKLMGTLYLSEIVSGGSSNYLI